MTDRHCFISYSTADALEFARQLADKLEGGEDKFVDAWLDKRDINPARDWDDQIVEAIRACKCTLFVMTKDSTAQGSMCKNEWTWALKYKKPVVPIRLQKDAEQPFGLGNRQWIDFTGEFEAGLAKLRMFLRRMDSPEGQLDILKDRLADAQRDLRRASKEDQPRIKAELEELTEQIKRQEEIVRNPKAAEEKTEKNIQSGLERERKPELPITNYHSTKFINPPPGIAPNYFQDRFDEIKEIKKFLENDSQRLLTIVGRAGIGKTAMVCRLLKALERGELPDDLGDMKADGIVYLSETGSHRVNFANVFADLSKLLPPSEETTKRLEGIYKNPQTSTGDKMRALLDAFPSGRVILLLDNFETLIDPESLNLRDSELREALNALLGGQHHAVKAVITTRIAPRDLAISEPGRQHHLSLDEGLESPYAENVLREMDADGRVGLKSAPDALLNKAREKTRGYPRALEALYAILSVDRYTTLEELLELSLPDEVVQKLVGEAFNRLDPSAQKVMQALAVYNRPVSPAAIDYLLQPHLPSIDSALVLNRLVNMHFARREAGRYYLHPADKEYAFGLIGNGESGVGKSDSPRLPIPNVPIPDSRFTQHDLLNRAADYFAQARKPRAEWKKLDDLSAQLAEFDLRCAARDYDMAANVLSAIDDLKQQWGNYWLTIRLNESLLSKVNDPKLRMFNYNELGWAYFMLCQINLGLIYYHQGLAVAQENKDRGWEGAFLGNLGGAYAAIGNIQKALECSEQQLANGKETGNRKREGVALGNIGNRFLVLGDMQKAREFYEQALAINHEIHDQQGETINFENIGSVFLRLGENQNAEGNFKQAIQIADEISFSQIQSSARYGLAKVYLFQNDLVNARVAIEAALQYDVPKNNHNASALHGIIALRQGERETAQEAFTKSIAQADEILAKTPDYYDALDAKGLSICGLTICVGDDDGRQTVDRGQSSMVYRQQAIETFKQARRIAPHAGIVKSVLRLFDELAKCDSEGVLKGVRDVIEATPLVE